MKDSSAQADELAAEVPAANAAETVNPQTARTMKTGNHSRGGSIGGDKFTIVALGGSAGSLDALEQFFTHLPPLTGLAFVVVVHLPPTEDSHLAQVLQNFTQMPVQEAHDDLRVQPNHVYTIPPDCDMSIQHGALHILKPTLPPAQRMPIDFFLQSLAKDAGERAVCILLSGLGSDGSLGLKLVMENFGMVMVQDPATAAFAALPQAALATEFVDFVLAPELLPGHLLAYVERPVSTRVLREQPTESSSRPAHALRKIFLLIQKQTGHDFSFYKRNTVFRRIERRMNAHQISDFADYVRYLQENPYEVEQLFRELLIGVTKFFRDPEAFDSLKRYLCELVKHKEPGSTVRVWAPGCSTGEEAYSLAITLLECMEEMVPTRELKLQIFATDISIEGIDAARTGVYSENTVADVSPTRLERFFMRTDSHYQIRKQVRDVVVFAAHNLNRDAPFTKLDLLCCRNLLIYLSSELQRNLLPVFHYALNPEGMLFLGPSENLAGFHELFQPLDIKWKISRRNETVAAMPRFVNFPFMPARQQPAPPPLPAFMSPTASPHRHGGSFAAVVQKSLLQAYTPPAVVIHPKGEILYVNGRTGKYLEPAPGVSSMNIFDMARAELTFEISGAVHRAIETREDVTVDNVRVQTEGGQQLLRLTVKHLHEPEALANLLLVVFEDQPTPRRVRLAKGALAPSDLNRDDVVAALNKELQYMKHRLQTTVEEMDISLEELKSTNEELQSANEELQSTNEEAMTNKEEMQSLNEELLTLNMQYQAKTEELSQSANDMKNLLDATQIATIFLDNDMVVKRFTPQVTRILNLLPSDAGRPLSHFSPNLRYPHLVHDVQQVLDRLVIVEVNIETTSYEWYAMRILPYRSLDNYINGAVITFTDITSLKQLEARLQQNTIFIESMQEAVREPMLALNPELRVLSPSRSFAQAFGLAGTELSGQMLTALNGNAWNQPRLREYLAALFKADATEDDEFDDFVLEADFVGLGRRRVHLYGHRMLHEGQPTGLVLLGVRAVEEL
jgi:two-component system CheB/CheR fusion protein